MPTPILVFTGDNHLRPRTWAKHPELYGDAYASWRQIVDFCLQLRLPLLQLGDLFDSTRPDSMSVGMYLSHLGRLEQARLPFYYVEGNHDKADFPWAGLTPWAQPLGKCHLNGVFLYGIGFCDSASLADELSRIPAETTVVAAHQSWAEIQRVGHTDGRFEMFPRGMTMLTGDYHVTGNWTGPAANGEPVVAYSPGSTAMQALNEPVEKYIGVLHDNLAVTWHQLLTRPVIKHTCRTEEELQSVINCDIAEFMEQQSLPVEIRKPILQVRYQDTIPEAYARLTAAAGEKFHLFLEPQREVLTRVIDTDTSPQGSFDSLKTAVGFCCDPSSATFNGVQRLLDSSTPEREIATMFTEFMENVGQTNPAESPAT